MNVVWARRSLARGLFLGFCLAGSSIDIGASTAHPADRVVKPNDNLRAAGVFGQGTLTLALRAALWQPEGHLHDYRQLSSGLYGPLIVSEPGAKVDPDFDHVIVLGRGGLSSPEGSLLTEPDSVLINGERAPRLVWKGSARHRVRIINITPDDVFSVSLQTSEGAVQWTPVAKDGVPLPAVESVPMAARQTIAVGETYDFEYHTPAGRRSLWMEVRTPGGKWQAQARVIVK
jgi:FtsP/CotA-like multicopper oxidase with cupredoxin domain